MQFQSWKLVSSPFNALKKLNLSYLAFGIMPARIKAPWCKQTLVCLFVCWPGLNWRGGNGRRRISLWAQSAPPQSGRHYACFMSVCGIPLRRLMPSSLSQARTRYPPAGCADLVNEFISWVVAAVAAALGPAALRLTAHVARQSGSQLRRRRGKGKERKRDGKERTAAAAVAAMDDVWWSHHLHPGILEAVTWWLEGENQGTPATPVVRTKWEFIKV